MKGFGKFVTFVGVTGAALAGLWYFCEMNKEKYRELQARENKLMRRYDKIHEKVEEAYRKAYPYLTSEKFWRKYLKLEEEN